MFGREIDASDLYQWGALDASESPCASCLGAVGTRGDNGTWGFVGNNSRVSIAISEVTFAIFYFGKGLSFDFWMQICRCSCISRIFGKQAEMSMKFDNRECN